MDERELVWSIRNDMDEVARNPRVRFAAEVARNPRVRFAEEAASGTAAGSTPLAGGIQPSQEDEAASGTAAGSPAGANTASQTAADGGSGPPMPPNTSATSTLLPWDRNPPWWMQAPAVAPLATSDAAPAGSLRDLDREGIRRQARRQNPSTRPEDCEQRILDHEATWHPITKNMYFGGWPEDRIPEPPCTMKVHRQANMTPYANIIGRAGGHLCWGDDTDDFVRARLGTPDALVPWCTETTHLEAAMDALRQFKSVVDEFPSQPVLTNTYLYKSETKAIKDNNKFLKGIATRIVWNAVKGPNSISKNPSGTKYLLDVEENDKPLFNNLAQPLLQMIIIYMNPYDQFKYNDMVMHDNNSFQRSAKSKLAKHGIWSNEYLAENKSNMGTRIAHRAITKGIFYPYALCCHRLMPDFYSSMETKENGTKKYLVARQSTARNWMTNFKHRVFMADDDDMCEIREAVHGVFGQYV